MSAKAHRTEACQKMYSVVVITVSHLLLSATIISFVKGMWLMKFFVCFTGIGTNLINLSNTGHLNTRSNRRCLHNSAYYLSSQPLCFLWISDNRKAGNTYSLCNGVDESDRLPDIIVRMSSPLLPNTKLISASLRPFFRLTWHYLVKPIFLSAQPRHTQSASYVGHSWQVPVSFRHPCCITWAISRFYTENHRAGTGELGR